jgi:hypothetical protein
MTNQEKFHLFDAIDNIPEFEGAGVAYLGDGECEVLRDSMHISGFDTWIVLEAYETSDTKTLEVPPTAVRPKTSFWKELLGLGINCSSAVLTGAATAAETAAAPVTGGASLALVYVTGAGAVATSLQCGLSVGRVVDHFIDPEYTELLDSEEWYSSANDVLDIVSDIGAVASVGQAVQGLIRLQKASGRSFKAILKGMTRAERKRLARELAQYLGAKSSKQFKALVRAGELATIYTQKSIDIALKKMLLDSISSALTIAGSAGMGVLQKAYLVYVVQEA